VGSRFKGKHRGSKKKEINTRALKQITLAKSIVRFGKSRFEFRAMMASISGGRMVFFTIKALEKK
jgi:hypothetical protein